MQGIFKLDGIAYDAEVKNLSRSFDVLDGSKATRVMSGGMIRDIIGTYYNYEIEIDTADMKLSDYDDLYERISAPQDSHLLEIVYAQSYMTFEAYITSGSDSLKDRGNNWAWWTGLKFKFVAMEPQRRP
jgi:hypothetical protein